MMKQTGTNIRDEARAWRVARLAGLSLALLLLAGCIGVAGKSERQARADFNAVADSLAFLEVSEKL